MVEISEIVDRKSLHAWLGALPKETEVEREEFLRIAHKLVPRIATRAIPIWWDVAETETGRDLDFSVLPVLRCNLISLVATLAFSPEIGAAAVSASRAAGIQDITASPVSTYGAVSAAALGATFTASGFNANAIDGSSFSSVSSIVASTAFNASNTFASSTSIFWSALRLDCEKLLPNPDASLGPLWPNENPLETLWTELKSQIPVAMGGYSEETARGPVAEDWSFWVHWYDSLLAGKDLNPDMLTEIALIDPEIWDKGPNVVNPIINGIWETYTAKGLSYGEQFEYDPDTEVFVSTAEPAERQDRLEYCVSRLNELDALAQKFDNLAGSLRAEFFLIRRAVEHHPDNAVMVHQLAKDAHQALHINIQNGACPNAETDPVVGIIDTTLIEVQTNLSQEPSVLNLAPRPDTELLLSDAQSLEVLNLAAYAVADVVEETVAKEMREDADALTNPAVALVLRSYRATVTAGRIIKVWLAARYANFMTALNAAQDISEKVKIITVNVAKSGVAGGGAYATIQAVLNSDKIAAAIDIILKLLPF